MSQSPRRSPRHSAPPVSQKDEAAAVAVKRKAEIETNEASLMKKHKTSVLSDFVDDNDSTETADESVHDVQVSTSSDEDEDDEKAKGLEKPAAKK